MRLNELLMAADRAVRVRLLLDDGGTGGLDDELLTLHSHPNIEVRRFNPFMQRGWLKPLGYLTELSRTNRRMHNKSLSADAQTSIVGGRNVGNEYFGATGGALFADLDVLVIGPVVQDIEHDFDRYWNNAASYPIDQVVTRTPEPLSTLRSSGAMLTASPTAQDYQAALQSTAFVQHLRKLSCPWIGLQLRW